MTGDGQSTSGDRCRHRATAQRRTRPGHAMRAARFGLGRSGNYEPRMLPTAAGRAVTRQLRSLPRRGAGAWAGTAAASVRGHRDDTCSQPDRDLRPTESNGRATAAANPAPAPECRLRPVKEPARRAVGNRRAERSWCEPGQRRAARNRRMALLRLSQRRFVVLLAAPDRVTGRGAAVNEYCPQDQWNL